MVLLVTSDNEQFVVDKEVAERSVLIKNMLEGRVRLERVGTNDTWSRGKSGRCRSTYISTYKFDFRFYRTKRQSV